MSGSEKMKVKIFVAYHKEAELIQNEVLIPIHVGRDFSTSKWLEDNMMGDNTGDNISSRNNRYSELTAQYFAWKNYDKIGSFDYIGFCHYRRLFNFNTRLNRIENIISSANPKNMIITYNVRIVNSRKMLAAGLNKKLTNYKQKEEVLRKNLKNITGNTLEKKHSSIEFLYHKLLLCSPLKNISGSRYKLENIKKSLLMAVREKYALSNRLYKDINNRFEQYIINYIFNKNAHVSKLESKLILLDPKNVMERGYAIISQKENIISSVENIVLDKEMEIMMKDGTIYAYPEKVVSSEHNETYENTKTEKILK